MAYELVNSKRSKSSLRVVGNTDTLITLSQLSTNVVTEIVTGASISYVACSTDGAWKVYRGDNASGVLVLTIFGSHEVPFSQHDLAISNSASSNIFVTNSGTDGFIVMNLSKDARYTVDPDTGYPIV